MIAVVQFRIAEYPFLALNGTSTGNIVLLKPALRNTII